MTEPCEEVKRVEQLYEEVIDYMEKRYKDALDKIRAEIEEELVHDDWDFGQEIYYNSAINDVLQIIDKYMAESEDV